jgi:hypothetical protein
VTGGADDRRARVERLLVAARRLADPADPLGQRARAVLPRSTGLTPAGVDYALTHCLETQPSEVELRALFAAVAPGARAHVLLSANVFVAAHRAIALALASAPHVEVRASRREPEMAELLHQGSGGVFRLVEELAPRPSDHVWAYGRDETLRALRGDLPAGVVLHAHGDGIGAAVLRVGERVGGTQLASVARSVALDVIAFDQRGCLSPRVVFVSAGTEVARELALSLARELTALEQEVPRGELGDDELAAQAWYRATLEYVADYFPAGRGGVSFDPDGSGVIVPPGGRVVHVVRGEDPTVVLERLRPMLAAVGVAGPPDLWEAVRAAVPRARVSPVGMMQRPKLDGPVDRRPTAEGELL